MTWVVESVDADWDDESGQVEVRVELSVRCLPASSSASINKLAFSATVLAEIAAA